MQYAPVLIVTLNRYQHLKRCIESLRKNKLARYTDLYIGFDYPPNQKYEKGYHQVKKYLDGGIEGFHNVIIMEHTSNRGVYRNVLDLRAVAYEKYDRYIITEDDNEFSPNYLEYMNKGLKKYEEDDNVLAISGYCYPIESSNFEGNVFKCGTYFAAYGYGIWKQKEEEMRKCLNMVFFCGLYKNHAYMRGLARQSKNQFAN
ncbi:MAG: glycosyltransferase, partial [Lachnospiraceae bacterium]|nr:glycosyltransferase [Lachnospiraceae bacterium]